MVVLQFVYPIIYWWLLTVFDNYEESCCKYLHPSIVDINFQINWVNTYKNDCYDNLVRSCQTAHQQWMLNPVSSYSHQILKLVSIDISSSSQILYLVVSSLMINSSRAFFISIQSLCFFEFILYSFLGFPYLCLCCPHILTYLSTF